MDHWKNEAMWICKEIEFSYERHWDLIINLQDRWFEHTIDMDRNRQEDGFMLRRQYCQDKGMVSIAIFGRTEYCTILEMLAALAIRMDDEYGDAKDPKPGSIFEEMLDNLGLFEAEDETELDYILSNWMDRHFAPDGRGSIFPIQNPRRDQRKIQIWDQMQEYIREKVERG